VWRVIRSELILAILAGIDEAGFGPTLGPLVVTGVAFRVPDDRLDACLWNTLRESCCDSIRHVKRRLVIADSKKLHRPRVGLGVLERTALVMLAVAGHRPNSLRSLVDLLAPGRGEHLDQYPWYAGRDVAIPVSGSIGDFGPQANAVRRDCKAHQVALHGVYAEPLSVGAFNRMVTSTKNKAVVLLGLAMRVVDRILRSAPDEKVRFLVDRLGGRTHYRPALTTSFPTFELQILEESSTRSAYRLKSVPRQCDIEFVTRGDGKHFPVALASIYSKYLRELHMHAFNTYWSTRVPGLKPTAGYYTDAQRWLQDVSGELQSSNIDRTILVRDR